MILSQNEGALSGPSARLASEVGAFIEIRSIKNKHLSTDFYRVGETIGAGQGARDDLDPNLDEWGPCVLLAVGPDHVKVSWNRENEVVQVKMSVHGLQRNSWSPEGADRVTNDVAGQVIRKLDDTTSLFVPKINKKGERVFEFSQPVLDKLNQDSVEDILAELGTVKVKGGLKLNSLPARFGELGIRTGDVIVAIDDRPVVSRAGALNYVRKERKSREVFKVTYSRDGVRRSITIQSPRTNAAGTTLGSGVQFGR